MTAFKFARGGGGETNIVKKFKKSTIEIIVLVNLLLLLRTHFKFLRRVDVADVIFNY